MQPNLQQTVSREGGISGRKMGELGSEDLKLLRWECTPRWSVSETHRGKFPRTKGGLRKDEASCRVHMVPRFKRNEATWREREFSCTPKYLEKEASGEKLKKGEVRDFSRGDFITSHRQDDCRAFGRGPLGRGATSDGVAKKKSRLRRA